jgi:hypothetical protein
MVSQTVNMKIISVSSRRKNIQMVVYHNQGADGKKQSITRFEPQDPSKPCYKRFGSKPTFSR